MLISKEHSTYESIERFITSSNSGKDDDLAESGDSGSDVSGVCPLLADECDYCSKTNTVNGKLEYLKFFIEAEVIENL